AYMEIYGRAKRSIHIVDDYISLKTLHLLCGVDSSIRITIISDNLRGLLHESDYQDCIKENPDFHVEFIRSMGASHDRFIVLDHGTEDERLFHCGSSSKDSGNRITVISELLDPYIRTMFSKRLSELLGNPQLVLWRSDGALSWTFFHMKQYGTRKIASCTVENRKINSTESKKTDSVLFIGKRCSSSSAWPDNQIQYDKKRRDCKTNCSPFSFLLFPSTGSVIPL
ncbi:MAG: hypothetical protein II903_01360, partial [Spirochaetales bacterium]|nr:hypothetical protein [Spirochaetales bacterium]